MNGAPWPGMRIESATDDAVLTTGAHVRIGRDGVVVTRAGTELTEAKTPVVRVSRRLNPVVWHDAVVRAAVSEIRAAAIPIKGRCKTSLPNM